MEAVVKVIKRLLWWAEPTSQDTAASGYSVPPRTSQNDLVRWVRPVGHGIARTNKTPQRKHWFILQMLKQITPPPPHSFCEMQRHRTALTIASLHGQTTEILTTLSLGSAHHKVKVGSQQTG